MHDWFDELDLDPTSSWLRMGTRALGSRPWLVADERHADELALKARLIDQSGPEVLRSSPDSAAAEEEVLALVTAETGRQGSGPYGPLGQAARVVQEDLCLLRHRDGAWHLDAACVCFPSRWSLADKIGRPLAAVHDPVEGYADRLARGVDRVLDRLDVGSPVWRQNWFVHPDGALFQPDAPAEDPVVPAARALAELHLRSERQTLRRLQCGWVLFTIRVRNEVLAEVLASPDRLTRFVTYLREAPADQLAHRGLSPDQVAAIAAALEGR